MSSLLNYDDDHDDDEDEDEDEDEDDEGGEGALTIDMSTVGRQPPRSSVKSTQAVLDSFRDEL